MVGSSRTVWADKGTDQTVFSAGVLVIISFKGTWNVVLDSKLSEKAFVTFVKSSKEFRSMLYLLDPNGFIEDRATFSAEADTRFADSKLVSVRGR